MEQLLIEQKAEITAFKNLYEKFSEKEKDEVSIQTLREQSKNVKIKFDIIENRDGFIRQYLKDENSQQPYFTKEMFMEVQALNAQFIGAINEAIKKKTIRPKSSTNFELPKTKWSSTQQQMLRQWKDCLSLKRKNSN